MFFTNHQAKKYFLFSNGFNNNIKYLNDDFLSLTNKIEKEENNKLKIFNPKEYNYFIHLQ